MERPLNEFENIRKRKLIMQLPEAFRQRILTQKYISSDLLFSALEKQSAPSIRINRLKWDRKPADSEPVPWCSDGFTLRKRPSYTLDPLFHAGCYYPQESSGMFLGHILMQVKDERKGIKVLDLCGAPGGKSTHLSSHLGADNLLVANEVIRSRAAVLSENLTKWGLSNSIVTQSDPSAFGRMNGFFDMIVVDAPCSGEGMFRDPVAVNEWSENNAALCSERQKRILLDVWPALKKDGFLIYSTCTFNPGENEENIKWLSGNRRAETVKLDISGFKGITEIDWRGIYGYGFYPGKISGEGFFISVLRKTESGEKTVRGFRSGNISRPGRDEEKIAGEWISGDRNLIRKGNEIISIPCSYEDFGYIYENLKVIKAGTRAGEYKNRSFVPDHELAVSVLMKKGSCPSEELEYDQALAFLSKASLQPGNMDKGWNIMSYRDVTLGFVKNLGTRVNNYYPVEWRIKINPADRQDKEEIQWV